MPLVVGRNLSLVKITAVALKFRDDTAIRSVCVAVAVIELLDRRSFEKSLNSNSRDKAEHRRKTLRNQVESGH